MAGALLVALLTAGASACGGGQGGDQVDEVGKVESTLSFAKAQEQARSLAQSSVAALPAGARLEEVESGGATTFCADRSDPPRGTPVTWGTTYEVSGVSLDAALLDDFAGGLESKGWKRSSRTDDTVTLRNTAKFDLALTVSKVKVSLSVDTPCVEPADPDDPLGV